MAGKIFVNYRRDDARDMAARVRDRLAQRFSDANVFMDVDNLFAGQRFDRELEKALGQTDVFLAVIGPRWLELFAERQANSERDYVREEIAEALRRGITVIPVLVERTPLPGADTLPEDIRDLVLHQKHVVTHEQFGRDVAGLVEAIRFGLKATRAGVGGRSPARWGALAAGLALLVLGGGVVAHQIGVRMPWKSEQSVETTRQEGKAAEAQADREAQTLRQREAAEKARQEEGKRALDSAAAQKADQEAQATRAREEAERQQLARLKREQERKWAEEDRQRAEADEEARVKAEAARQRLAMLQQEEQKRQAEADASRAKQEQETRDAERRRLALLKAEEDRQIAAEKRQADERASKEKKAVALPPAPALTVEKSPAYPQKSDPPKPHAPANKGPWNGTWAGAWAASMPTSVTIAEGKVVQFLWRGLTQPITTSNVGKTVSFGDNKYRVIMRLEAPGRAFATYSGTDTNHGTAILTKR